MSSSKVIILIIAVAVLIFPFQSFAENGKEVLEQSQQEVSGAWEKIKDFSEKAADAVFEFFKRIWQGIGDTWKNYVSPWLENFWNTLKIEFEKEMEEMKQDTSDFFKNLWNKLLDWLKLKKD